MLKARLFVIALLLILPASALLADDLTGANKLLCTSVQATSCNDDGDCVTDVPWSFNIPQFVEVDFATMKLSTTKAADDPRESPIGNVTRANGLVVLQGLEEGRAYSFVINEKSGRLSVSVARDGITVSVFGACTPLTVLK